MISSFRSRAVVTLAATAALAAGVTAGPAAAATQQQGLVNVSLTDINVPIGIAANVCNVTANALASQNFTNTGDCDALSTATTTGGHQGNNTRQRGLVNVSASDINIPVSLAANVCNVTVNLLAAGNFTDTGSCDAISSATA
jgi:hypothetical protein